MRIADQISRLTAYVASLTSYALRLAFIALLLSGCTTTATDTEGLITASGFIEGQEVTVAPETQGLIAEIRVARGDDVTTGDVVVRLDDASLKSQRAEVEAALATARANLDRVLAGARAEDIDAARASLEQAEARRNGAEEAVLNARQVISNPLSLEAQIDEARSQVKLAEQNVEFQEADLEETKIKHGVYVERGGDTARSWDLQLQAARARLDKAQAELSGAWSYLGAWLDIRDNPLSLKAELHRAQAEYEQAQASVNEAQAQLDELQAGPREADVALAEAQVRQAEAGVALIDARLDQLTLRAPMDGIVSTRSAQVGETATAGKPLLTIANLDEVTLVLYIPENRIGQVQVGQRVEVTVDSFPDRVFVGHVDSIAGEAEFTPRNVQTKEERVNLVFAVDVSIPNPDHALKPGLPADATIVP
jgi:multidrug resistance efflux pump